jgi:Mg2+ and Co2+ transporter CorA
MIQMFQERITPQREEKILLSSLATEVDTIFLQLRKAHKIINRELGSIDRQGMRGANKAALIPIDEEELRKIIAKLPSWHFTEDKHIVYMLEDRQDNIFKLIREYNEYLDRRNDEIVNQHPARLRDADEQIIYYIQRLGAMIYHLNIHLNQTAG